MIFKEEERIHVPPKWIAIWAIAFATILILAIPSIPGKIELSCFSSMIGIAGSGIRELKIKD